MTTSRGSCDRVAGEDAPPTPDGTAVGAGPAPEALGGAQAPCDVSTGSAHAEVSRGHVALSPDVGGRGAGASADRREASGRR